MIVFLPKLARADSMKNMRGISLVCALLKWYLACLTALLNKCTRPLHDHDVMLVGGEKGCSAAIIYASLQMIAQKAHEWAHQTSIYV